jgi:hypothetical protein
MSYCAQQLNSPQWPSRPQSPSQPALMIDTYEDNMSCCRHQPECMCSSATSGRDQQQTTSHQHVPPAPAITLVLVTRLTCLNTTCLPSSQGISKHQAAMANHCTALTLLLYVFAPVRTRRACRPARASAWCTGRTGCRWCWGLAAAAAAAAAVAAAAADKCLAARWWITRRSTARLSTQHTAALPVHLSGSSRLQRSCHTTTMSWA